LLIALGGALLLVAGALRICISRQLASRILNGYPEIAPSRYEKKLVTEGIYSRVRHPRYMQLLLALLGYAVLTNYLAVYVLFVASVFCIYLIVLLEERELRERFGQEYERYCQRVPRFVPRWS
jgi:protein-S-isoprenylcysteine O-methyltransferase Ste14